MLLNVLKKGTIVFTRRHVLGQSAAYHNGSVYNFKDYKFLECQLGSHPSLNFEAPHQVLLFFLQQKVQMLFFAFFI